MCVRRLGRPVQLPNDLMLIQLYVIGWEGWIWLDRMSVWAGEPDGSAGKSTCYAKLMD